MNWISITHFLAQATSAVLGILVFYTNPRRRTNQFFLVLTILVAIWLACLSISFTGVPSNIILWCVRGCLASAALMALSMDWLRISIVQPTLSIRKVFRSSPLWLAASLVFTALSLTPYIVIGTTTPPGNAIDAIPEPVYGFLFPLYLVFYLCNFWLLVTRITRDIKNHKGVQRIELQFIFLGSASSIVTGIVVGLVAPLITGSSQSAKLIPLSVICMYAVIAYGIATRRIMDVAYFLRIVTAYSLLIVYLVVLYGACWWSANFILRGIGLFPGLVPHVLATLAVAFSLAPVHGLMQRFANRLFVHFAPLNMNAVVKSAGQILRHISTIDNLLNEFATLIGNAVGVEHIVILLSEDGALVQRYPRNDAAKIAMKKEDILPVILHETGEALVPEIVKRLRTSPRITEACRRMEQWQSSVAIGIQSKEGLEGLLLLGPKLSRRIYNAPELQALQFLCNQLAVSLTNARLYTQLQDSKIYNDILVDNLASGVIAAGNDNRITVFNREAQRLTGLSPENVIMHPIAILPAPLSIPLKDALQTETGVRDLDTSLQGPSGNETPIRISTSVFYGHAGKTLGTFMVINDLSAVKQLESQLRRTDRLASLGTLAAGMAHEIKNPLVSIKTFTQLLPERYEDADFRDTFFSLVGGEVKRIDGIVNQLLRFSKPAQPILSPTSLHKILDNAVKLMYQQMLQKEIRVLRHFAATADEIQADGDQLTQAFINFFLNAVESMTSGGTLTLSTAQVGGNTPIPIQNHHPSLKNGIAVTIEDSGEGIASADISHIFDPFFTTKSQGTGLGLSVSHGIIQEHGGVIDVKSERGRGTTFIIVFPITTRVENAV